MTTNIEPARPNGRANLEVWVRRGCALIVAAVAAYSSYEHQRGFALRGGADATNAMLWPLSVDGLLLLATVGLLKPAARQSRRMRVAVWPAFLGCIAVSLAANVAAAPRLAWQPVLVAGWPPVALLLAVEPLAHRSRSPRAETEPAAPDTEPAAPIAHPENAAPDETQRETGQLLALAEVSPTAASRKRLVSNGFGTAGMASDAVERVVVSGLVGGAGLPAHPAISAPTSATSANGARSGSWTTTNASRTADSTSTPAAPASAANRRCRRVPRSAVTGDPASAGFVVSTAPCVRLG